MQPDLPPEAAHHLDQAYPVRLTELPAKADVATATYGRRPSYWLAEVPAWDGCNANGATPDEALRTLREEAMPRWLAARLKAGGEVPPPEPPLPSGRLQIHLAPALHAAVVRESERQNTNLNSWIALVLARFGCGPWEAVPRSDAASSAAEARPKRAVPAASRAPRSPQWSAEPAPRPVGRGAIERMDDESGEPAPRRQRPHAGPVGAPPKVRVRSADVAPGRPAPASEAPPRARRRDNAEQSLPGAQTRTWRRETPAPGGDRPRNFQAGPPARGPNRPPAPYGKGPAARGPGKPGGKPTGPRKPRNP